MLLDEQFKFVQSGSGAEQVGNDNTFTVHTKTDLPITKSGYLYVFVSNETPNIDVFFDNLQVTHTRGPILEETHYYSFGLTMAGISSKAALGLENKYKFNGIEQNNDFDLNMYDAFYRNLDPQIGRFWQIDPKPMEHESLYSVMSNNPILLTDFLGDTTIYYNMANGSVLGTINNEGAVQRVKVNATAYLVANVVSLASGQELSKQDDANTFVSNLNGTLAKADETLGTNLIAFGTGELKMEFTGAADANNPAQANGTLNVNAMFDDGSNVAIASYQAVGGPYGNGAPENGFYTANNLQDRSRTGWYNPGMNRDGVGFSMNLNPQFSTWRTLERIHPDGRVPGTQGCIGLQVDANQLQEFRSTMSKYLSTHANIHVNVNILGNPNNNGRGARVKSNGE